MVCNATQAHLPGLLEITRQKAERGIEKTLALLKGREKAAKMCTHTWEAVQHPSLQPSHGLLIASMHSPG